MEKIVIQIWKNHEIDDNDFKNFLINEIPLSLRSDLTSYQVNLPDKDVSKAAGLVQSSYPPSPNAIVFLKVKSLFHVEQKLKVFESHAAVSYTHLTLPTTP